MSNKDAWILQLIDKIDSGRISADEVSRKLDNYEKASGELDMIYAVEDRTDPEYYDELLANARMGIYNRDSLIKMARMRYTGNTSQADGYKKNIIIAAILIVIAVIGIVITVVGGKS